MADFHQHGIITTLHHLETLPLEELEAQLMSFRKQRPMALVLPSLYSELEGPALSGIVDEFRKFATSNRLLSDSIVQPKRSL